MITSLLIIPLIVSFFVTLIFLPYWIRKAFEIGLVGRDMNKFQEKKVAESGGINVIAGFTIGVLVYVALKTFYFQSEQNVIEVYAILSSILMISFVGLVDGMLGWKKGLRKKSRLFLVLFASIPLVVINAGESVMGVPFFGTIDFGLIYPLILIPIGLVGASTTFNFLAGFNGLEARQGILILLALAAALFFKGESWISLILLCMIASLIAFLFYNSYPSKVFPGDVMTYGVGSLIAISAILGNVEKFAIFIFIPNIIEVILKLRGNLVKESFAVPNEDNTLKMRYEKIYGLEHFAIYFLKKIKKRVYERDVVNFINFIQILFIIVAFIIFRQGIFL